MTFNGKSLLSGLLFAAVAFAMSGAASATTVPGIGQDGAPTLSGCLSDTLPPQITSGWIQTNQGYQSPCSAPGSIPGVNWQEMTYFLDLPVGATLDVCLSFGYPTGWAVIAQRKDPSRCGYFQGQVFSNNVVTIRRNS